ncbi:hypothetical protein [Parageobacillus toebii]|uniref:hypothetical protein n=1 Tax=Parageobacillus toebii TaxID=153151 RepID=UPI002E21536D|nr:hypothetical protein [Parageobacillus toebii]
MAEKIYVNHLIDKQSLHRFHILLLSQHLSLRSNFLVFAVPCIISALAISFVQEKYSQHIIMDNNGKIIRSFS